MATLLLPSTSEAVTTTGAEVVKPRQVQMQNRPQTKIANSSDTGSDEEEEDDDDDDDDYDDDEEEDTQNPNPVLVSNNNADEETQNPQQFAQNPTLGSNSKSVVDEGEGTSGKRKRMNNLSVPEKKPKKAKKRLFSKKDEILLLNALVSCRGGGLSYTSRAVLDRIRAEIFPWLTWIQLKNKVIKLQNIFEFASKKGGERRVSRLEAFTISNTIWGFCKEDEWKRQKFAFDQKLADFRAQQLKCYFKLSTLLKETMELVPLGNV